MAEEPGSETELSDVMTALNAGKIRFTRPIHRVQVEHMPTSISVIIINDDGNPMQGIVFYGLSVGCKFTYRVDGDNRTIAYSIVPS